MIAAALLLAMAAAAWFFPPSLHNDPASGIGVLWSMMHGGGFNMAVTPDPADIARDTESFMTWWSPGQYLAPGAFVMLGLSFGHALTAVSLVAGLLGVWGWRRIGAKLELDPRVLAAFGAFLACSVFVSSSFRRYDGGEILLFAATPWALLCFDAALRGSAVRAFASVMGAAGLLFIAKLSGLVVLACGITAFAASEIYRQRRVTPQVVGAAAACASAAVLYVLLWASRGETPATMTDTETHWLETVAATAGSTAFSALSVHPLLNAVSGHFLGRDILSWNSNIHEPMRFVACAAAIALAVVLVRTARRMPRRPDWLAPLGLFCLLYGAAIVVIIERGGQVFYDERHLRPAGICALLLMLAILAGGRWIRAAVAAMVIASVPGPAKSLLDYSSGWNAMVDSASGMRMETLRPEALAEARRIASSAPRSLVVVAQSESMPAFPEARVFSLGLVESRHGARHGRAGKIIVVASDLQKPGDTRNILRSFVDYDPTQWVAHEVAGQWIYEQ